MRKLVHGDADFRSWNKVCACLNYFVKYFSILSFHNDNDETLRELLTLNMA